jgi:hypothetical protein
MTRRDRCALALALEVLRAESSQWAARLASDVLERGDDVAEALGEAVEGQRSLDHHYRCCGGGPVSSASARRLLRARLALVLRAMLRADKGDFGPTEWHGCNCSCDGDRGGWLPRRITPLWELAPAHGGGT